MRSHDLVTLVSAVVMSEFLNIDTLARYLRSRLIICLLCTSDIDAFDINTIGEVIAVKVATDRMCFRCFWCFVCVD